MIKQPEVIDTTKIDILKDLNLLVFFRDIFLTNACIYVFFRSFQIHFKARCHKQDKPAKMLEPATDHTSFSKPTKINLKIMQKYEIQL